jgi:hypothetical protein
LDALSSGSATAQSAPAVKHQVVSGTTSAPTSGGGIGRYVDALGRGNAHVGGAGIPSYWDTLATGTNHQGGGGITSYLGCIGKAAPLTSASTVVPV